EKEGQLGMRPIIHIECHGDASDGLEFANGSELSWDSLEKCFTQLNCATRLNTIAIVSACFGAHFISRATPILPAPFFALISPTDEINPYEIKTGLEGFYQSFLSQVSIDDALIELKKRKLLKGSWFSMSAEQLFVENLTLYIQEFCSRRASIERAKKMNDAWASAGKPKLSQNNIFKMLRNRHKNIESEAFNTFFCINKIPENALRFNDSLIAAKKNISKIRAEGRHII
ncbi:MAG: hypothetical protein ACN6OP_07335, partial [Pseudomonadales bacterium]